MRRSRTPFARYAGFVTLLILTGCGGPKAYVRPGFLEHPPKRVALLPFVITYPYDLAPGEPVPASHQAGRDIFRRTFYYTLATYGYEDAKPQDVDAALTRRWGPIETGAWYQAPPQDLGQALGADAVIYGELDRVMRVASPMFTETSLQGTLRMVDTASGDELWRQRIKAKERGGAFVQKGQVVDFIKDQMRSYDDDVMFLRVAEQATRQVLKGLPDPPMTLDASPRAGGRPSGSVRLALLPLEAKAQWQQPAQQLRRDLAAHLERDDSFEVLELGQVDAALRALGWTQGQPLPAPFSLPELAKTVGADAVVRGAVTKWGRSYWVVESWVSAAMRLELVDTQTGNVVWSAEEKNSRTAGILKGPTGYKSVAMAPLSGLKRSHLERVADDLARKMAEAMSRSPGVLAYLAMRGERATTP